MLSYILVAAIFMSLGIAINHYFANKEKALLIKSHEDEIRKTQSSWFDKGWKDCADYMRREHHYDLIKRGVIED